MSQPSPISFNTIDIDFEVQDQDRLISWVTDAIVAEGARLNTVSFIYCSDNQLLTMNQEHLGHDFYTDVITFPYQEDTEWIEGDIFISIDRVKENAEDVGVSFEVELRRVMIHGVLHLLGYADKSDEDKKQMTAKEDYYLEKY